MVGYVSVWHWPAGGPRNLFHPVSKKAYRVGVAVVVGQPHYSNLVAWVVLEAGVCSMGLTWETSAASLAVVEERRSSVASVVVVVAAALASEEPVECRTVVGRHRTDHRHRSVARNHSVASSSVVAVAVAAPIATAVATLAAAGRRRSDSMDCCWSHSGSTWPSRKSNRSTGSTVSDAVVVAAVVAAAVAVATPTDSAFDGFDSMLRRLAADTVAANCCHR